jgi:hypothetical protein
MQPVPDSLPLHGDALIRGIGFWGATALVIGNVLGAGIFLISGPVTSGAPFLWNCTHRAARERHS